MQDPVKRRPLLAKRFRKPQLVELLLDVSNRIGVSGSLSEALMTLAETTASIIGAERGSIFLNDPATGELYSRISDGKFTREIRILNTTGVAGHVFSTGKGAIIHDAYSNEHFNPDVDSQTGFTTQNILCAPLRTLKGELIGVSQLLNKKAGQFTEEDRELLEAMIEQGAIALESHRTVERVESARRQELEMLKVVSDVSSELKLAPLLQRLIGTITSMLDAERSTLFLNDEKTSELYTEVGQGLGTTQIRLPNSAGIAGAVFTSRQTINIPHAYADLRFNPAFDRKTGFFTRSILCVPVVNKDGKTIGVTQVLNKRGGIFTEADEARLKAFTSQISIGLENAKLFDDVQNIKNYNESILESMSNCVITLNEEGKIVTCNTAGLRILKMGPSEVLQRDAQEFFSGSNSWVFDKILRVKERQERDASQPRRRQSDRFGIQENVMDAELVFRENKVSVNLSVLPLIGINGKRLGTMIMIEDITSEKRMRSTMSRYMDPSLADQILEAGEEILVGQASHATILFSDIRGFTTLTEELGPQGTVSLLNEYFTVMVDCIQNEGGMLDKFIGDAIMAVFGTPLAHDDDEDRAVRASIAMLRALNTYNEKRLSDGKKPIDIGIGLNSDTVVSGNIGSPKRMDYTVVGDGVNLASRLEGACKQYGARLLISEHTFKKLRGTYRSREIDRVVVKGKTQPVAVYEVVDYHSEKTFPNMMGVLNNFKFGLEFYRGGKFDDAIRAFTDAIHLNPGDFISMMYLDRCEHLKKFPPGVEWDGVWVMKSK